LTGPKDVVEKEGNGFKEGMRERTEKERERERRERRRPTVSCWAGREEEESRKRQLTGRFKEKSSNWGGFSATVAGQTAPGGQKKKYLACTLEQKQMNRRHRTKYLAGVLSEAALQFGPNRGSDFARWMRKGTALNPLG
jgi:hypothetical protein